MRGSDMADKEKPEFSKKKYRLLQAHRAVKALVGHSYTRDEIVMMMKLHRIFTDIIESKREDIIRREKPASNIILPGDIN